MTVLDDKDRRLIGLLRHNSRAPITTLADELKVSRATVQSRLDRLIETRVITRFTIELAVEEKENLVRAIMMIEIEGNLEKSVTERLRRMPAIANSYSTNGKWDLVAVIETDSLEEFDRILREIRHVRGVRNSDTSILLAPV